MEVIMPYVAYQELNFLEDFSFSSGEKVILNFNTGTYNISAATISWSMCQYGDYKNAVLTKTGTVDGNYTFSVTLDATDTVGLSGKFIQQPIIYMPGGIEIRPQQGTLIIY